jgi:hypothetical protein
MCISTYVGISGGTDIDPNNSVHYPDQSSLPGGGGNFRPPSSNRVYSNVYWKPSTANNGIMTISGMLPFGTIVSLRACTDGTSNTAIVGEQSDWLRQTDPAVSTYYFGTASYHNANNVCGWLPGGHSRVTNPQNTDHSAFGGNGPAMMNLTVVRYKPDLKKVMGPGSHGSGGAQGCHQLHTGGRGYNNPLQSAHPGGLLVALVDGSVQFISGTTDLAVLLRLAIRDDGQNVKLDN